MAQNDIRVRLTPEGVAEVIRALRQVNAEASSANRSTSVLLREIKSILPTIGFGALVTGFAGLVRGAANYADAIGKAGLRTGSSAENFSVLAFAAKTADIGLEELEQTLARFARQLDGLREGAAEPTAAFRELGLAASDFEGKDTAESFALVSERLVELGVSAKQTTVAMSLLGRGGARTLTLVRDLGEKGFREVAKDAEAAGAIITAELAASAEAANDSFTSMGILVQGLALQFVSGLAPSVNTAMTEFRDDVQGKGTDTIKEFGESTGRVVRVVVAGLTTIGSVASTVFSVVGKTLAAAAAQAVQAAQGNFTGVREIGRQWLEDVSGDITDGFEALDRNLEKLRDSATTKPIEIKVKTKTDRDAVDEGARDAQQQIQQRLQALSKASGTDELKTLQEVAKQRRAIADEAIGLELERARVIQQVQGETRASLERLQQAESAGLASRVQAVRNSYAAELAVIQAREQALSAASRKQFGDTRANQQLQTAIAREATQQRLDLATKHYSDLARLQQENIRRYGEAQQKIRQIDQETADLKARHEAIFANAARSRLTEEQRASEAQRQGFEQIRQLRAAVLAGDLAAAKRLQEELTGIVQTLAEVEGFEGVAKQISDDALALDKLLASVQKGALQKSAQEAQKATQSLDKQLEEALGQVKALQQALVDGLAVTIKMDDESLRKLVEDVQRELDKKPFPIRVAPQLQGAAGGTTGLAEGGPVPGVSPSPTADDKLVRLTSGEFVQPVRAVRHYGPQFMELVRTMKLPKFADGGYVRDDEERDRDLPKFSAGGHVPGVAPSPKADNVIARLTPGEFVMPVPAVQRYGLNFMEDVRKGSFAVDMPRFAEGGRVTVDDIKIGAAVHMRPIPGYATGGLVRSAGEFTPDNARESIDVNLNIGGKTVKVRTEREEADRLVRIIKSAKRGTGTR